MSILSEDKCVMMDRYGNIHACIDHKYHPNPGTEDEGYPEIERSIDWLVSEDRLSIIPDIREWIAIRCAKELSDYPDSTEDEVILNTMYSDLYKPCQEVIGMFSEQLEYLEDHKDKQDDLADQDEIPVARRIVNYLNENFLRIRTGGKFNIGFEDSIYFRISSHGYDWRHLIEKFLLDEYENVGNMPGSIWVGHDAETNPPETVIFSGPAGGLFNKDSVSCKTGYTKWK